MIYPTLRSKPVPNFPQKPDRTDGGTQMFPNDLIAPGRNFYTQIQFVDYEPLGVSATFTGAISIGVGTFNDQFQNVARPSKGGGIFLPIPQRLNDNMMLDWTEFSILANTPVVGAAASSAVGSAGSIALGKALNPLMFLQFKKPEFRLFQLSWVLAPRTEKESITIKNIITKCKKAAAPTKGGLLGELLGYPQIALIKISIPEEKFEHMQFKPCVITSVQANYTPNPTPSFFENGAPSAVTLTLNLKEMSYWYRDEIK